MREDKEPKSVVRERPKTDQAKRPHDDQTKESKFTHEDRLMFPAAKLTKGDLIAYYDAIADKLMPHLTGSAHDARAFARRRWRCEIPSLLAEEHADYYPKWIRAIPLKTEDGRRCNICS